MGCVKHNVNNCTVCDNCSPNISISVNRTENNSIGRDGEDAYEAYVRNGGTMSYEDWALSADKNSYSQFNWI